ncbi:MULTISPECIES: VanZ family protein [unclassified Microbacterium]|uniref:VanZ family protein n=1 Tax=unclassified Microbacterium TaxID=2609290 RepID=UPI00214C6C4B|nr:MULTISPECIES: VanZ family protein [unclassified Microbacterium]MCR2785008.1 VanZ family protein [Microbacterium sp. zg.B96]WIM16547.1 VanZ family protein [Microbacterium sp. zg-B96]
MTDAEVVGRRWVLGALALYAGLVGLVLLLPVSYGAVVNALADALRSLFGLDAFGSGWIEFTANIVMFIPLGFLFTLLVRRHWLGVVVALAASVAAELAQLLIPSREPSLRDVLANTVGAGLGAVLAWMLVLRRRRACRRAGSVNGSSGVA